MIEEPEHKAHHVDAPLWSDEEHVQKGLRAPQSLGVPEHWVLTVLRHVQLTAKCEIH